MQCVSSELHVMTCTTCICVSSELHITTCTCIQQKNVYICMCTCTTCICVNRELNIITCTRIQQCTCICVHVHVPHVYALVENHTLQHVHNIYMYICTRWYMYRAIW